MSPTTFTEFFMEPSQSPAGPSGAAGQLLRPAFPIVRRIGFLVFCAGSSQAGPLAWHCEIVISRVTSN